MNGQLVKFMSRTAQAMRPSVPFRYILGLHIRHSLLVLGFLLVIIVLGQYSNIARYQGGQSEFSASDMLLLALLNTPTLLQYVLPHVVLVSAALAIYRLGARFELVVMMTARLPAWRLLIPLFVCGAMMGLIYSLIGNPLSSFAYDLAAKISARESLVADRGDARRVVMVGAGGTTYVFADQVNAQGSVLNGISVFQVDDHHRLIRRVDADVARLTPEGWHVTGTRVTPVAKAASGTNELLQFDADVMTGRLTSRFATPFYELPAAIAFADKIGAQSRGYRLQLQWLIALPVLLGSISCLAGAIVMHPLMTRKWGGSALQILLASFLFYSATTLLDAFSQRHLISPAAAAWLPPFACLLAATVLLVRKRI